MGKQSVSFVSVARLSEQGRHVVTDSYKQYERYVRCVARKTRDLTNDELVEVVQEVFLAVSVAVAKDKFPVERGPIFKWLKTATRWQTVRYAQKRNARGVTHLDAMTPPEFLSEETQDEALLGEPTFSPEAVCIDNEHRVQVMANIRQCSHRQRLFLEAVVAGEDFQSAGKAAGIPKEQVGTYAKRSREQFLAKLSQELPKAA